MRFLPNTKRKTQIFESVSSAAGFFVCLALAAITTCALASYARQILLPEVSHSFVLLVSLAAAIFTAVIYLFSAEWIAYPAAFLSCTGVLFLTLIPVIEAVREKIIIIGEQIYQYEPDYALPYFLNHGFGLSVAMALLVILAGIIITHFLLRCMVVIPMIVTAAATMGIFISLERNDGGYFYIIIICLLAMICVAVQAKAGKGMDGRLPVTKIGTKTVAFLLAAALTMFPVAGSESFSKALVDAFSNLTGINPPGASPGGFGDASGDVSMDGFEQFLSDLEERQAKTDLEDVEFQQILLYIVGGASDSEDIYFRRRIYGTYSDSAWTLETSDAENLKDNAIEIIASKISPNGTPAWRRSRLNIAAIQKPLYLPVATGTVEIDENAVYTYFDLDGDQMKEQYPAYGMSTYRIIGLEEESERFEFLKLFASDSPLMPETLEDIVLPVSGDELLDEELRALAEKIILCYTPHDTLEEWLSSEDSTLEAVEAIQTYLAETKFYTMNPQMSDRYENYDHTKDSIYNFLFNTGEGYCVQFSSAAVLLLRAVGVNARYVTGFSSRSAANDGFRYIYDNASHAWCEVYLDEVGWVPFEMTYAAMINSIDSDGPILDPPVHEESEISEPEASVPDESSTDVSENESSADTSETESSTAVSETVSVGESGSEVAGGIAKTNKKALLYCISVLLCVIIIVLITALIYRRNEKRRKSVLAERIRCSLGVGDPTEMLLKLHTQHIKLVGLLGYKPEKVEKHGEYVARIRRSDPDMPNPKAAMDIFRKAEFGGKPSKEDLAAAGKHILLLNDYVFAKLSGFKKKRAYFKGLITKPRPKKEETK